ncbi:MAG: YidC/Oxa1 family membrane protein insertase [Actinomycetota bacterium]|nr:YidC/Oxa1 family membrane protein insertase [Actinomycetota bacterium]
MVANVLWQGLLNALGWVLAWIYDIVPNYGIAIIVLTLAIRLLLLPLGIKQIKSMQHMQALQPKLKELQKKYKNNRQKQQEEQMKLYKEAGVNPLGGCLPMLLTLPFLFAMYAVIRPPTVTPSQDPLHKGAFVVANNHLPEDSALFQNVLTHQNTDFLFMNLQCNLVGAGTQVEIKYKDPADGQVKQLPGSGNTTSPTPAPILGKDGTALPFLAQTRGTLDCGHQRFPDMIPYILLLAIMVGSTFFQTWQMQRASPKDSQSSQQQAITRVMPLMFAFFGLQFPAGLVLYWTVSNGLQVAQQTYLLHAGHIGPEALERRMAEQNQKAANPTPKRGVMSWMTERAQAVQNQRGQTPKPKPKGDGSAPQRKKRPNPGPKKPTGGGAASSAKPPASDAGRRRKGAAPGNQLGRNPKPEQPEDEA